MNKESKLIIIQISRNRDQRRNRFCGGSGLGGKLVVPKWRYSVNNLGMQTEAQETGAGQIAGHVVIYLVVMVEAILLNFWHYPKFSGKF